MSIAYELGDCQSSGGAKCQTLRPYGARDSGGLSGYKHSAPTERSQKLRTEYQELSTKHQVQFISRSKGQRPMT
jgi:hypothetical protein